MDGKQNSMSGPTSLTPVIDLGLSPSSSENLSSRSSSVWADSLEQDTGDSRATATALKVYMCTTLMLKQIRRLRNKTTDLEDKQGDNQCKHGYVESKLVS